MSLEHIKTPLGFALPTAIQKRAEAEILKTGRAWPCTVAKVISSGIVVVNFEVDATPFTLPEITVPLGYPEYIRYPIQDGDKGWVQAADARLGGITGLGTGTPDLSQPGNLSALVFYWLGNTAWSATDDPQALVLYGPNGAIIRDKDSHSVLKLTPTKTDLTTPKVVETVAGDHTETTDTYNLTATTSITLTVGGHSIVINSSGVTIDGKAFLTHMHTLVQTGTSNSGPVT